MASKTDPNWPRALAWLDGECFEEAARTLAVLDAPLNRSISPGDCHLAPRVIRKALDRCSTYDICRDVDVRSVKCVDSGEGSEEQLAGRVADLLQVADSVALLGGDNGITFHGVQGLGVPLERCGLITLDAHLDLRDTADGPINGNPVRMLLEAGLPGQNIAQIGLAAFCNSREYTEVGRANGILFVDALQLSSIGIASAFQQAFERLDQSCDAIYFDLDLDCLDRAFAPGCPGARPGGITPQQAMEAARIAGQYPKVRAMDLVELDPSRDVDDRTAFVAAFCLLSFAAGLAQR